MHTDEPITIALEDPADPANAVGTVEISHGAFCASSPSRRHWSDAAGHQLHHLLNAIDGLPVDDVAATWVAVTPPSSAITTEDIDAWQQCLDNGKPRYRRFVEHRCGTRPCHTGRRTRHCSVHHLGHPVTRSFPLRMRHPQRQPHRRPIPQFSGRFFHTLMYEIISITSSGAFPRVDRWVAPPSVSYADSSPSERGAEYS